MDVKVVVYFREGLPYDYTYTIRNGAKQDLIRSLNDQVKSGSLNIGPLIIPSTSIMKVLVK